MDAYDFYVLEILKNNERVVSLGEGDVLFFEQPEVYMACHEVCFFFHCLCFGSQLAKLFLWCLFILFR